MLLALLKAESTLHGTLLNGSERPNVVSEKKGRSGNKRKSLEIDTKPKMDDKKEMDTWRREKAM